MIKAIIFDFDGVICHDRFYEEMLNLVKIIKGGQGFLYNNNFEELNNFLKLYGI